LLGEEETAVDACRREVDRASGTDRHTCAIQYSGMKKVAAAVSRKAVAGGAATGDMIVESVIHMVRLISVDRRTRFAPVAHQGKRRTRSRLQR